MILAVPSNVTIGVLFDIFDDGLQERRFDYDIKFVCFDAKIWLGNGYLLPSGPLRENINSLKKYDGVFLKITDKSTNFRTGFVN